MSEVTKCAACGKEKPVGEMKTCMHAQMHRYVCDSKCMDDFYNPPKKPSATDRVAAREAENARFQSVMVGMIDLAHEYRHLLTQQRFPDNDEGDAFRRHRDAQVLRIERILSAAHAAKVKSHE